MYNEREIERRAWRKYGSPSHFERLYVASISQRYSFLIISLSLSLSEAFSHYRGRGPFQYPSAYRHGLANNPEFVAQDVQPSVRIPIDYDSLSVVQQVVYDLTDSI